MPYGDLPAYGSDAWKAGVPRDVGADWDFDDVRDHYLRELYGEDAATLAARDPALFADLSRATSAHVMEATLAEWRRPDSPTRGGVVWTLQDVVPGAGWGVLDAAGAPKAAWYRLKRAFRPVQLTITDEGVNGLALHVLNETAQAVEAELSLVALAEGARPVVRCARTLALTPRSAQTITAFDLLGAFFDFGHVYRFGPPAHDAVVARLATLEGATLAQAVHYPLGRRLPRPAPTVTAILAAEGDGWMLTLETDRLVEEAWIGAPGLRPDDDGFALAPGLKTVVRLKRSGPIADPAVTVRASGGAILCQASSLRS